MRITIPNSVTEIGDDAFAGCKFLAEITIPDSVTSIGSWAFHGCSNLKSLYLPANIKTIGDAAFNGCGSLTRINAKMKDPVAIGKDTFTGLDYDKCELLVPEGSAEAYRQAAVWSNFNNITDITVVVTDYAGLLQYMIEKNDKNYKNNITRLKVIGPIGIYDIQYIREMAGCWLEERGKKTDGNLQYLDLQEAKLVGSNVSINVYTNGSNQGETNTVECTAKIEPDGNDFSNLFRKVSKLNTVIMPEYLTTTGSGTFMNSPLSSITLPKNLTSIDDNAFNGCDGLRDISIPSGVTSIGDGAFKGCWLQHIYLHYGLKSIGNYAFANSALKEINIPNSVAYIGDNCFQGCGGLEEAVILSDQITEIPNEAFADCNALNIIKLPANLERIGERAFIGTWRLGTKEGLTIPSKVREIGAEAFYKSLFDAVDIVLPASLTNIYSAFEGSGARVIHCYMPEPLPLNGFSFGGGGSLSNCKLYVPKGCANKYRDAEVWRDFDIEEIEVTGIGSATNDSTATEVARYDANGNLLAAPAKGLNIVRYSDGTVKKIMVE
ncbi:MAG: leucine-rich repeat domain-containing protein [Prevotella sp.]|nr:leucine-rich repeat domain-containing protein [Prevotella sp.]